MQKPRLADVEKDPDFNRMKDAVMEAREEPLHEGFVRLPLPMLAEGAGESIVRYSALLARYSTLRLSPDSTRALPVAYPVVHDAAKGDRGLFALLSPKRLEEVRANLRAGRRGQARAVRSRRGSRTRKIIMAGLRFSF